MSNSGQFQWITVAEGFPPGLASYPPDADLKPDLTPEAYGLDCTAIGYLKTGSVPTGTSRVVRTYLNVTNGTANHDYEWHFRRLWRFSTSNPTMYFGSPDYTGYYYPQERGEIDLNDDTGTFVKMLPVGDSLVLFKTTGAHVILNANDYNANFRQLDLVQEAYIANATHAVELDNVAYFSNDKGLFSMTPDGQVTELSVLLRDASSVQSKALTCDYARKHVICGTSAVYDVQAKKFFDYGTAGFLYRIPTLRGPLGEPLVVNAIALDVEHAASGDKTLTYSYRSGRREWTDDYTTTAIYDGEAFDRVLITLDQRESGRTFDFRVTSLDANLYIRRIHAEAAGMTQRSREM